MNRAVAIAGLVAPAFLAASAIAQTSALLPNCTASPAGLIGWWPFDEMTAGSVEDRLGVSPGRHLNGPRPASGLAGGALLLDGRDDYVEMPGFRLDVDHGDFSLGLWIQTRDASPAVKAIVDKRVLTSAAQGYELWLSNGRIGLQMADGTGSAICSSDPRTSSCTNFGSDVAVADGSWHFFVASVNRRSPRGGNFYVDGRVAGSFDPTIRGGSLHNDGPLRVGALSGTPANFFSGLVDELQVVRRALSPGEVAALFRAGPGGQCKALPRTVSIPPEGERQPYASGVVVIRFDETTAAILRRGLRRVEIDALPLPAPLRQLNRRFGVRSITPLFPAVRRGAPGGLERFFKLAIDQRVDTAAAALAYAKAPGVESAEPDRLLHAYTNDPYYTPTDLWGLFKVNSAGAWPTATGAGVVVAVVDSGVDTGHADLAPSVWTNPKESPGDGNNDGCPGVCGVDEDGDGGVDEGLAGDDDENGFVDDFNGWDFVQNDNTPQDLNGHGTHVAGTIAAVANNSIGVVGLAYGAKLMAVRGLDQSGSGLTTDLASGIVYAASNGAGVINDSWGGFGRSPLLDGVVAYARGRNVVVVNAAGNSTADSCFATPANVESGLTVASTGLTDAVSSFSNYGVKLDVAAPGEGVLSTKPGNAYQMLSGTSMATPHVAALAALLRQAHPSWSPEEIRQAIRASAADLAPAGFDPLSGYGRIDAAAALQLATPRPVASLEEPYNCSRITGTVNLVGWSGGTGFTGYEIAIGAGVTPTSFTAIATGSTAVNGGMLASFNTTTRPDGLYTLRLLTKTGNSGITAEDRNVIIIDNAHLPGWPADLSSGNWKSPLVADLDADGTKEVVLGASVFNANGVVRAGWDANAGLGRTNPAVVDIDGDGRPEVIAAVFSCYYSCTTTAPNAGAVVIYAYNHDKTVDWSFTVTNPLSVPGFHHGVPSSISVADLDGDGTLEVVFTVVFNYNNSPLQTYVFVLDAQSGSQEASFPLPGLSWSSVALAPSGSGRLLVISTDQGVGVHVVDKNGNPASGWPQMPGLADADPVVADFDRDGAADILVGTSLWSLGGTLKPGWPGATFSRTTAAAGQLAKQDCELEAVLGGGNNVVYSVNEHNAALISLAHTQGENLYSFVAGENGSQGVPIVADLDGDGEPEIVRHAELGFINGNPARLYGYETASATAVPGFPRHLFEPDWIVRSSAAVDDVDGDGNADLLIVAGGQLHAWNLRAPFKADNPWPMFQHDLTHTGYLPAPLPTGSDLWVEDTPYVYSGAFPDTGDEPAASMAAEPMWTSRAIWVRNQVNDPGSGTYLAHQNPMTGQVNEVYIEVKNRGCTTSPAGTIEARFAEASVGLQWPSDWNLIGTATVPALAPGQSVQVRIQWTPPAAGHFCLLARITSEPMTTTETGNIDFNVRRNNNLAWRNVNVVDLQMKTNEIVKVNVANVRAARAAVDLRFRAREPFVAEGGTLVVDLGRLFAPWRAAGGRGRNVAVIGGTRIVLRALPATVEGIAMGPRQRDSITISVQATEPLRRNGKANRYAFDVIESIAGVELGGVSYSIVARGLDSDTDGDGIPDVRDPDDDNDGLPDVSDPNPLTGGGAALACPNGATKAVAAGIHYPLTGVRDCAGATALAEAPESLGSAHYRDACQRRGVITASVPAARVISCVVAPPLSADFVVVDVEVCCPRPAEGAAPR